MGLVCPEKVTNIMLQTRELEPKTTTFYIQSAPLFGL